MAMHGLSLKQGLDCKGASNSGIRLLGAGIEQSTSSTDESTVLTDVIDCLVKCNKRKPTCRVS